MFFCAKRLDIFVKIMKDGIYVTAYLYYNKIGYYNHLTKRHDPNITIWKKRNNDISILKTVELERLSGVKHHNVALENTETAEEIIKIELSKLGINIEEVVEIWGTPIIDKGNISNYSMDQFPDFTYHTICHLFSSVFSDSNKIYNEEVLGFAMDNDSDSVIDTITGKYNYIGCYVKKGKFNFFSINSHGPIWLLAAQYFKLREGTLMALANATTTKIENNDELLLIEKTSHYKELKKYFSKYITIFESYNESNIGKEIMDYDERFSFQENLISAIMKNIQKMSFDVIDYNVEKAIKKYHINPSKCNIALAGGSTLNCPANTYIMHKYSFKSMLAIPNVNDTGISVGMGLYAFYKHLDKFNFKYSSPFMGNEVDMEISEKHKYFIKSVEELDEKKVVEDIKKQPILWLEGRSEVGPRALGHRSIIGDPTNKNSKDIINNAKQRQWWRPVAPIILQSEVENWFEDSFYSPYMLNNFKIKQECKKIVPAILHLDDTARVQTLDDDSSDLIIRVLKAFMNDCGVPILCNTSLNDKGEPIIESLDQAINFALRKSINTVYCNGKRYEVYKHNEYQETKPLKRDYYNLDLVNEDIECAKKSNPFGLTNHELYLYLLIPNLSENYDITDEKQIEDLRKVIKYITKLPHINMQSIFNKI